MNKTIAAAAALGMFGTAAHAQSSVTLYGLIDAPVARAARRGTHSGATRHVAPECVPAPCRRPARPGRRQMLIVTGPASGV
ncbi:hypothetical protein WI25_15445 [Burkholderia cepacia]|nr:hypothetical protein [Burkholderia cepacia]KUY69766.1 hypothetical protein WI25_15445 [Burkholderia cepacia]